MPVEFVQREGVALVEMELRVSNTEAVPVIGQSVVLQKAEFNETCDGICTATFTLNSATRDYVDNLLKKAQASETPSVRWRIGIGSQGGLAEWIPWQSHVIRSSSNALVGLGAASGYLTILRTADFLWEIGLVKRTSARKGKVSDIVRSIADFYGLPFVIEPTKTDGLYYQSFISDYEFIKNRMVPRAINDKNRGNYQFYLRDGTLHFHTIDYRAELKNFVYFGSPGSKISYQDFSQDMIEHGAAGVRVVYYDPYTGKFGAQLSKPEHTLRLSNTSPDLTGAAGTERNIMLNLGTNRDIDATSLMSNVFESSKSSMYSLNLTVPKTVFFRANDLCRVTIQPDSGQVPPSSGTYQVHSISHNVDKTSLVSEISLRRGEFLTKDKTHSNLSQPGSQIIQPPRAAEGQDPNIKSVVSSTVTRGSGKQMSRTVVLDTLNPNKSAD